MPCYHLRRSVISRRCAKTLFDRDDYSAAAATIRSVVVEHGSPRTIGVHWRMTW